MRRIWRLIVSLITGVVVLGILAVAYAFSGIYNVAATYPDIKPVEWIISTTLEKSVHRRAEGIKTPDLDDPSMIRAGFGHYREMCVFCHGAPGVSTSELAQGLNPRPPKLAEEVEEWKPNELFWITKNGIRMTGMPAWGPTHSDDIIWQIVAFLETLPTLTEEQYKALDRQVPRGGE